MFNFIKRTFDIFLAVLCLILFALPLIIIALLVRWNIGVPVLFRQPRPGKGEKIFQLVKFRTMTNSKGPDGNLLPDGVRLTAFGKILRTTSLDELPTLWNVLIGDMSIVGPRPLLTRYLSSMTDGERERHNVRPGITGLAQISGRNTLNWDDRLALDVYYVNNKSLIMDVAIIFKTIHKVLSRDGVVPDANLVMEDLDVHRNK